MQQYYLGNTNRTLRPHLHLYQIAFRSDVKNTYPHLLGTLFSEELLQQERGCFTQLLKVVHSVSDRCCFAPLRKAIRYSVNVA